MRWTQEHAEIIEAVKARDATSVTHDGASDGPVLDGTKGRSDPWTPIDLAAVAAAGLDPIEPDVLFRRDGRALFYTGKLNVIFGAPEAGKTWIAIIAIAELVRNAARTERGIVAVFIDYEDDARSYLVRLQAAGISPSDAAQHTRYYSIAQAIKTAPNDLEGLDQAVLVVVDTTNSAMTLDGLDPVSNKDALAFINDVRRLRSGNDAGWLLLDHEPINTSGGRRQAIGAQAKLGAVDGAQYRAAAIKQPRPGNEGTISLHLTKDRAGGVREHAADPDKHGIQHAATIHMNPIETSTTGRFRYSIVEPQEVKADGELDTAICIVCTDSPQSKNQIRTRVRARGLERRNGVIDTAVDALAAAGHLEDSPKANYVVYQTAPDFAPTRGDRQSETSPQNAGDPLVEYAGNVVTATETGSPENLGATRAGTPRPSPLP